MYVRHIHKGVFSLVLVLGLLLPARCGLARDLAAELQAAFLVRFSRYVSWPPGTLQNENDPITIGILGRDPFGSAINRAARGIRARGRHLRILRLRKITDARRCNILFIAPDQAPAMDRLVARLQDRPILLVSDMNDFLARGGMIRFVTVESKIRFDINLANCKAGGLEISSKLLKIAHRVTQ